MRRKTRAAFAGAALLLAAVFVAPIAAHADDYPSWDDVERARNDESAKASEIEAIRGYIAALEAEVERTRADLEAKGLRWQQLDSQYQKKTTETATLREQAVAAEAIAIDAEQRAGEWAAQVVRIGGSDPTLSLFSEPENADELLSAIGVSTRISQQANTLYEQAVQQRNTAQALTNQAAVMETELERLEEEARVAMEEAQAASEAATAAVLAQQEYQATLEAQLAVLTENRAATEADYETGKQKRLEEQLKSLGVDWGQVSASGWIRPAGGFISSGFGYRAEGYHEGVDLAQSCWNPILAAHSGVVTYAGWLGGYGNAIDLDHGGGLTTRYGHQPYGGFTVGVGDYVEAGQQIGNVGTTGNSTGCHLHFEVRVWGGAIDPVQFLAANGVYL